MKIKTEINDRTATTVKIKKELYGEFKILGIRSGLSLQDFVEKCVHLYVDDTPFTASFRNIVNNFVVPILSTTSSLSS